LTPAEEDEEQQAALDRSLDKWGGRTAGCVRGLGMGCLYGSVPVLALLALPLARLLR
jgi:hypothetical protein